MTTAADEGRSARFYLWRRVAVALLLLGYLTYYFNRTNLSVTSKAIMEDLGFNETEMGVIVSVGYAVYAVGKFVTGTWVERLGGRNSFLLGLGISSLLTIGMSFCKTVPAFTAVWSISRFAQSIGWGALVRICSCWFESKSYGRVMGMMSLSYMLGDALIRLTLGVLQNAGLSWEEVFYVCASLGIAVVIPSIFLLKQSPLLIGESEPHSSEKNVYGEETKQEEERVLTLRELMVPLLKTPKFYILLVLSIVLTLIRETFNSWTPIYLSDVLGLSDGDASMASMVFPFFGTISALIGGWLVDRVRPRWRGGVSVCFLLLLTGALIGLAWFSDRFPATDPLALPIALTLISLIGLFLMAPYSFLDGIYTLELGGKHGCAATASIINGAGYLGATFSGFVLAMTDSGSGWGPVFLLLALLTVASMLAFILFWYIDVRDINRTEMRHSQGDRKSTRLNSSH